LEQIDQAKQHLAFTRDSAASSINSVSNRTHGDQRSLHGESIYWDEKIVDAKSVLQISKTDLYKQVMRESMPFCWVVLGVGALVFIRFFSG